MKIEEPYKVSILVPVYGVERFIERCARSLFEQTYENLEYVFVDDCSPDESIDILKTVMGKYPNRIDSVKIIHNTKNTGVGEVRNIAVNKSSGDFVFYVDSDDYIEKDAVEKCVRKQIETEADIVVYEFVEEYKNKSILNRVAHFESAHDFCVAQLARETHISLCGEMIRRSLYVDNDIKIRGGCNFSEDYQMASQLSFYAKKIAFVNEPLYHYDKTNEQSYTSSFNERNWDMNDRTNDILWSFFKDKGKEFVDACNKAKLRGDIRALMDVCKVSGHDEFYERKSKEAMELCKQYGGCLSMPQRMFVRLLKFRPIVSPLIRMLAKTKAVLRKL